MKNKTTFLMVMIAVLIGFVSTVLYIKYQNAQQPLRQGIFAANLKTQESCEEYGHTWMPVGKAQIAICVEKYSDAGKECESSTDCKGNCIKKNVDGPATCEQDSAWHGCKNTVENIAQGEGILCID